MYFFRLAHFNENQNFQYLSAIAQLTVLIGIDSIYNGIVSFVRTIYTMTTVISHAKDVHLSL